MEHLIQFSKHVHKHPPTFENTQIVRVMHQQETKGIIMTNNHMPEISFKISHCQSCTSTLCSIKENYKKLSENKIRICLKPKGRE